MNYIYFLFFTVFFVVILTINNFNILSVSIQSWGLFWAVSLVFLINASGWGIELRPKTILLIIGSLLFMFLGERFCKKTTLYGGHNVNSLINDEMLAVKKTSIMVMFLIGIIVIILDYKHVLDVARGVGYAGGSFVLNYARKAYLYDNVENNIFVAMIQYFVIAFGYVNIAILIRDVTKNGLRKLKKRYIFGIAPLLLLYVLSTGRTGFLQVFMYSISMFLLCLYRRNGVIRINNKKAIGILYKGILVIGILFVLLGMLTGKTQKSSVMQIIGEYFGSGIAALNTWIEGKYLYASRSSLIGEETFRSLYQLIARFVNIPMSSSLKEFISFNNGDTTNVYTAFRDYYSDFGMFGTWMIEFMMGFFLTYLLGKALKEKNVGIHSMLYAYFSYGILRQITAAHFISSYFNIQYMFVFLFMILIMRYMKFEQEEKEVYR